MFTWSGYDVPEAHPAYDAKYGAPDMPLFSDEEEAFQKLRAGYQVDIAHPCSGRINRWRSANLLQPIDTSKLSNWGDVFDGLKVVNDANKDGAQWFVPWDWGNTSVIYRADLVDIKEEVLEHPLGRALCRQDRHGQRHHGHLDHLRPDDRRRRSL